MPAARPIGVVAAMDLPRGVVTFVYRDVCLVKLECEPEPVVLGAQHWATAMLHLQGGDIDSAIATYAMIDQDRRYMSAYTRLETLLLWSLVTERPWRLRERRHPRRRRSWRRLPPTPASTPTCESSKGRAGRCGRHSGMRASRTITGGVRGWSGTNFPDDSGDAGSSRMTRPR